MIRRRKRERRSRSSSSGLAKEFRCGGHFSGRVGFSAAVGISIRSIGFSRGPVRLNAEADPGATIAAAVMLLVNDISGIIGIPPSDGSVAVAVRGVRLDGATTTADYADDDKDRMPSTPLSLSQMPPTENL